MKKRHKALLFLFFIVMGLPFTMWMFWALSGPRPISVFIMDKTSHTDDQIRNRAFHWFLKHYRFVKPNGRQYDATLDYYGFFPLDGNHFTVSDLSRYSTFDIQRLALQYHAAYYTDVYGVHESDGFEAGGRIMESGHIYGGLGIQDIQFLEVMHRMERLIIAEFSFLGAPTQRSIRLQAEELFGIKWHGWIGRYFQSLDRDNPDEILPGWLPAVYESQYRQPWQFTSAGAIFVHENGQLIVLEDGVHLTHPVPVITSSADTRREFDVNDRILYPGWFEVTFPAKPEMEVLSWFELSVSAEGNELLHSHNIPARFPAVIGNTETGKTFYFTADFSQNPLKRRFVRFKGARFIELFLADLYDPTDKSGFFLAYYFPLLNSIFRTYHAEMIRN